MDGNRRFARERGWDVARGHRLGYDKLEEALRWCCELGVHGVTVYAFSIENFKRSAEEVAALMALTEEKLRSMSEEDNIIQRRGVRVRVVGDLSRVSSSLAAEMRRVMRMTQGNTRHTLTVCFSYTATNEIATAVRRLADACERGLLLPADLSADLLERCLHTSSAGLPPVDLIVRTSGEKRLSDFLLWQSAVCAVAFTRVLWPELSLLRFLGLLLRFQRSQPYLATMSDLRERGGGGSGMSVLRKGDSRERKGWCGGRVSRAAQSALFMLLPLSLICALALALSSAVVRASGIQTELPLLALASACLGGWLVVALLPGVRLAAPPRSVAATHTKSAPLMVVDAGGGDAACSHRIRDFLAGLGVDRRL